MPHGNIHNGHTNPTGHSVTCPGLGGPRGKGSRACSITVNNRLYSQGSLAPNDGVGKADGRTEQQSIAARRRNGRVNAYSSFSIRASPKVSNTR